MANLSAISRIGLTLASACLAAGCMAVAASPGLEELGSLGGNTGGAFSGFAGTQSNVEVNKSWEAINKVQTRYTNFQMAAMEDRQRKQTLSRDTALGILKDIRDAEGGNPVIANLIVWVKAGGDSQTALNYALNSQAQRQKEARLRQTTVGLLQGLAQQPEANPDLPMLISWVRAGGDPQYALNYALTHRQPPPARALAQAPAPRPPASQSFSSR